MTTPAQTPEEKKPETEEKPKDLLTRLKDVEKLADGLAGFVQNDVMQKVDQTMGALRNMVEVVNALIAVASKVTGSTFDELVQAEVMAARDRRLFEAAEREKKMLEGLKTAGILQPVSVIEATSVIIGRELDDKGTPIPPGYHQARFDQFTPEARAKLLGQGPGFMLEVNNNRFEVQEVLKVGVPKPPATTPAAPTDTLPGQTAPESSTEQAAPSAPQP